MVEGPATPGCLRMDRVRKCVGDSQSSVRTLWLAREETPGPYRFPSISLIMQNNTRTTFITMMLKNKKIS